MTNYITSSGEVSSGIILNAGDKMYIYYGGTATNTTINDMGDLVVYANGSALRTTINSNGYLGIGSKGMADSTVVNSGGSLRMVNGGVANSASISSRGYFYFEGGTATNISAADGARLEIYVDSSSYLQLTSAGSTLEMKDGILSGAILQNAKIYICSGGAADSMTYNSGGSMKIFNGGTANNTTVRSGGWLLVSSGGTAKDTTLMSSGGLSVSSGGTANNITFSSGGRLTVSSGGTATDIVWTPCEGELRVEEGAHVTYASTCSGVYYGSLYVLLSSAQAMSSMYLGGLTPNGIFHSEKMMYVMSGGTVNSIGVEGIGSMFVFSGGTANNTVVRSSGNMFISSGGTANSIDIQADGSMFIYSGGTASNVKVNSDGCLQVSSGGTATDIVWTPCNGSISIADGAHVTFASQYSGVYYCSKGLPVSQVQEVKSQMISETMVMWVMSGGRADDIAISGSVSEGKNEEYGYDTIEYSYGSLFVSCGGTASDIRLSGGRLHILNGGVANNVFVSISEDGLGGTVFVSDGGIVNNVIISGGGLILSSGSIANGVFFQDACIFNIGSGVVVNDLIGNTDCDINISSGGTIKRSILCGWGESCRPMMLLGSADETILKDSGWLSVERGGTATNTTIQSGGTMTFNHYGYDYGYDNPKPAFADGITIESGGTLFICKDSVATNIIASNGAGLYMTIASDTYAQGICDGKAFELKDACLSGFTVRAYSCLGVDSGGRVNDIIVESDGEINIGNGFGNDIVIREGGRLTVKGGMVSNIIVRGGLLSLDSYFFDEYNQYFGMSGFADNTIVESCGCLGIDSYCSANNTTVCSGGIVIMYGGKMTGRMIFEKGASVIAYDTGIIDYDLTQTSAGAEALINNLSVVEGDNILYTLTVSATQANGMYKLAGGAAEFNKTISVVNTSGSELGSLTVGQTANIGGVNYRLDLDGDNVLSVTVGAAASVNAKSDVDGNGISDVMFVWTGNNYAHGYWMNGTNTWQSANSNHPAEWENLGCHDMTGNGKADSVLFGNVTSEAGIKGAYIGYYADANDLPDGSTWVNIGYLTNENNIQWKNTVGNLTGSEAGVNSIVWYAPELYALGVWKDGKEDWATLSGSFGGDDWTLVGCGDFDGDGKDSVLMTYNDGQMFYAVGLDGTAASLGSTNWSGWEVRAIGDFSGDQKDDLVLFHKATGSMVMCANGNLDSYVSLAQLDANDWFVVGAGDYNGDAKDDLLVRQYSTGMLGYYSAGDTAQWVELGRGVDMNWTVIA